MNENTTIVAVAVIAGLTLLGVIKSCSDNDKNIRETRIKCVEITKNMDQCIRSGI